MSRLTRKGTTKIHLEDYLMNGRSIDIQDCLNKLGKLEDLEEQIGCPLEVFVKLQETHHIYTEKDGYIPVILTKNGFWWYLVYDSEYTDIQYPLSEYGKTFWLKEDKSE